MIIENYAKIKNYLLNKKFKNVFIISGKKSYFKSGANKIFESLLINKKIYKYFKKNLVPELTELKKIIKLIKKKKPDLILAVGGGTVIDYAKSANCLEENISIKSFKSKKLNFKKKTQLCVVPTTAGSGAEVTANAVIYIDKIKHSVENKLIKPNNFFLVPEFIIGSSRKLKASSGFDAIAQGIESTLSLKSNSKSLEFSEKSLEYAFDNFENFIKNPNMYNVKKMSIAANLSGKAISIARTIAPHAVSYPFTSLFKVSHGHAVSLTLSKFIKFNFLNLDKSKNRLILKNKFNKLFKISKTKNINEFCNYLDYLKKIACLEGKLKNLNINLDSSLEKILSGINLDRLNNNPIEISVNDIKKIFFEIK